MRVPLRARAFYRAMLRNDAVLRSDDPAQVLLVRERARRFARTRLGALVLGRPAKGVRTVDTIAHDGAGSSVPVRVYTPARGAATARRPAVLYFHGGGWVLGDLDQADWLCSRLASGADCVVVSVDYRLAPEHLFPAAHDDALVGLRWVGDVAPDDLGIDPARIAVMGDSAGGNLAASVAVSSRDDAALPDVVAQLLVYPATELAVDPAWEPHRHDTAILDLEQMRLFRRIYLGGDAPELGADVRASPMRALDHAGLPEALVQTAEHDPLRADGRQYARRLAEAGVPVRFTEYQGAFHGFASLKGLAPQIAVQALWEATWFLRSCFATLPDDAPLLSASLELDAD